MSYDFEAEKKKTGKFEPLPEDRYAVKVIKTELRTSTNDNEMISITYQVGNEGPFHGRKVFDNLVLTPKTLWKVIMVYEAMDKKDLLGDGMEAKDIADPLMGAEFSVFVGISGERNQVSDYKGIEDMDGISFDTDIDFPTTPVSPLEDPSFQ